jgi:hypothetical protein
MGRKRKPKRTHSTVGITDPGELKEFVRTHLGHRLTAMVAPLCAPFSFWDGRNDAYRAAKEGSYSMLRMFIEFLGVKSEPTPKARAVAPSIPKLVEASGLREDSILIDAFSSFGTRKVSPAAFGTDKTLIAEVHRTLCKINSHFTYDKTKADFYDRIASPADDTMWGRAVDIVIQKLDEHFYGVIREPITVHLDLERPFLDRFAARLGLRSLVKGDGLGRR